MDTVVFNFVKSEQGAYFFRFKAPGEEEGFLHVLIDEEIAVALRDFFKRDFPNSLEPQRGYMNMMISMFEDIIRAIKLSEKSIKK